MKAALTSEAELRTVYPEPNARAEQKVLGHLDVHCRDFIALSPLCILSSFDADGRADTSPRGDPPGFVAVLDDQTLLIPDRPGNNQIDSLRNIAEHPYVGLLFLVPGMTETLRVSGKAEIVDDAELLAPLTVGGKPPALRSARHRRGGVPALRQGLDSIPNLGPRSPARALQLPHLRAGAGRPDQRGGCKGDRRLRGRGQPPPALLNRTYPARSRR